MKRADLRLGGICHGNKGMRPCRKGAGLPFWVRMAGNGCLLLVMLVAGMGMAGCSEEQEGIVGELTPIGDSEALFRDGITFSFIGGEETLAFTTNSSWEAAVVQTEDAADTWCWLSRGSGEAGEVNLTVRAEENGGAERTASIVVSMGEVERVIPVKQTGNGTVVLHVEQAGELPSLIGEEMKYRVQDLTLSGELNGTDIRFIREMAGTDSTHCALKVLDLTDARLVEGGEPYYTDEWDDYTTENDIITDYLFYGCCSLVSIEIPESVTNIGGRAFYECSSLASIELPKGVMSIGVAAFVDCSSLASIVIPESVTSIGRSVFLGCSSLASIEIPGSITSIGGWAFSGCSSLTSIEIPKGVTSIEEVTFYNCSSLVSIELPEGVTSIGMQAFHKCSSLTSIEIPESVTSIGEWAFSGCSSLTSIEIPEGVTSIGESTFLNCLKLSSIKISGNVTSIGEQAFFGCGSLVSIEIPENVTAIGEQAFYGCSSLQEMHLKPTVPPVVEGGAYSSIWHCTLYVPQGSLVAYRQAAFWSWFKEIIEE